MSDSHHNRMIADHMTVDCQRLRLDCPSVLGAVTLAHGRHHAGPRNKRNTDPMTKQTKTTKTSKAATVITATKKRTATKATKVTPGVCRMCGFSLSDQRTRCRVAAACMKRLKVAA